VKVAALSRLARRAGGRGIAIAIVGAIFGLLGFFEPFRRPSYELSLAAGLVVPSLAAVITALELSRRQLGGFGMLARAVENGVALAITAFAVAFLHGLFAGLCDLADATLMFALGPGVGSVLGGVWGAIASEGARRTRRRRTAAIVFSLAGPLGSVLVELLVFYSTPIIFAYDPFVGYFSGALYDTVLDDGSLSSYRAATAATLVAVYVASLHLERVGGRLRFRSLGRPGLVAIGVACALGSFLSFVFGPAAGHWQTESSIREHLGAAAQGRRCEIVHDRRIPPDEVELLLRDCEAHVEAIERWLGAPTVDRVTAFLFRDRDQKRKLMGAAGTSVAKPWRAEIYLNAEDYPHPVIGHELVHVLAAPFGRGPFAIAGSAGGLLPNPGLIEGIAVAGSPHDDVLDVHGWAAAMRRLELLPRADALFSLAFFLSGSSASYTAAGSFVGYVHDTYGAEVVRAWYGGADLPELTGVGWGEIETGWWAMLDAIPLDEAAMATAEERFERPSVFFRRCPHDVDEALALGDRAVDQGDYLEAERQYARALALDPSSSQARFGFARCRERQRLADDARAALASLADDEALTRAVRDTATERIANLALQSGDIDEARRLYDEARARVTNESRRRTIDLLHHYAEVPLARQALLALLVGTEHRGPSTPEALDLIGRWREAEPKDGTPAYLIARQYLSEDRHHLAAAALHEALSKELPVGRVELEALRLLTISACALGRPLQAEQALARYGAHPLATPSRTAYLSRVVERCQR
jgi:tetratricopeptide (TPR) repeat protein